MSHNSQQKPGPVASDRAVFESLQKKWCLPRKLTSGRPATIPRLPSLWWLSQGCSERWSHLRSAPSTSVAVVFVMLSSCPGRPLFDHSYNCLIPAEPLPLSWCSANTRISVCSHFSWRPLQWNQKSFSNIFRMLGFRSQACLVLRWPSLTRSLILPRSLRALRKLQFTDDAEQENTTQQKLRKR